YGNIAPRVGVAYALTQKRDFVIRAAWGLFYDLGSGAAGQLTTAWPNRRTQSAGNVSLPISNAATFVPALPALVPPYTGAFAGNIMGFSPDLALPKSYQWNAAIEKAFQGQQVISATYVGQLGRELLRAESVVPPSSNTNFAPN